MTTLDSLAIKYKTDKSSLFHDYCNEYEFFLKKYKDSPITFLEIGVWDGRSIKMWLEYFSLAKIIGIDVYNGCPDLKHERYSFIEGNQTDENVFKNISNIDIAIDDGSHRGIDQKQTFEILFPKLNSGGIYIVEDVCTSYWKQFGNYNFIDYSKQHIDCVNFDGVYNEVKTEMETEHISIARASKYLTETLKNRNITRTFPVRSIYYGNSFIIFFKQ